MHFNGARTVREPGCMTAEKRGGSGCGWRLLSPRNVSTVRTALGFSRLSLVGAEFFPLREIYGVGSGIAHASS